MGILPTFDEEAVIYFDDKDVAQGGFTIGKHMIGKEKYVVRKLGGTLQSFKGNLWNNYPSPAVGIHVNANKPIGTGQTRHSIYCPL